MGTLSRITPHLAMWRAHINVGILYDGDRALLIDFSADAVSAAQSLGAVAVEALFTHHHRDQMRGIQEAQETIASLGAPAAERRWFADPASYWDDPAYRWHAYGYHPHSLIGRAPVRVDRAWHDGDTLDWGPARITALATPGHTDGSLSYLVEVDGRRVIFCGDLLYGPGQLWEVYSLQKGNDLIRDYHGYLGARDDVCASLDRLEREAPDLMIPSHGIPCERPAEAIAATRQRLRACYDCYAETSALHWYFPDLFAEYTSPMQQITAKPVSSLPLHVRHVGTTWVLVSESGAAFVMDCGSEQVVTQLHAWQASGEIGAVEGLWISHYHDDHVDGVPAFQQAFSCPLLADAAVAEVIADPGAWRLPCLSPAVARVDRRLRDGECWQWREFTMTAYHFPGQSLYHGGLLIEGQGHRLFCVGDSFAPTGMDDYCMLNRNFLGTGTGLDRCLALLQRLQPEMLVNPHVDPAFTFTAEDYRRMRENLARREALFRELLPWEHPNFGLDASWARCHPYEQRATPGATAHIEVVVTNHAGDARPVACRAVQPSAVEVSAVIPPKGETRLPLAVTIPADAAPGRLVVPVDIRIGDRLLPEFTEALFMV